MPNEWFKKSFKKVTLGVPNLFRNKKGNLCLFIYF